MTSYYREHVSYPNVTSGPYPPHLVAALDNVAGNQDDPNPKRCSVKGCSASLPADYPHKMCEECRGRHRVYAMTKRAKRKMEKALLNGSAQSGQPVAWMPPDDSVHHQQESSGQPSEPVAGSSRQYESAPQVSLGDQAQQQYDFSHQWDANSIDPRLFSQLPSHSSELAGALTLPAPPHHRSNHQVYSSNNQQQSPPPSVASPPAPPPPPAPAAPEIHPVLAEVLKSVPGLDPTTRVTSGPTVPVGASDNGPLPPRFCSIKGCKTLIAGHSFFKMCEPCRDRYRNYGTTKRAKWKREKEVAVTELNKLRDDEDARRAQEGLPPLPPPDSDQWQEYQPGAVDDPANPGPPPSTSANADGGGGGSSSSAAPLPPRMCTVSHCREILPGGYQYLRCERHRIQNRHHSKLKRVRDKEVKAQVYDGWAAAIAPRATSFDSADGGEQHEEQQRPVVEGDAAGSGTAAVDVDEVAAQEIAFAFQKLNDHSGEDEVGLGRDGSPDFPSVDSDATRAGAVNATQEAGPNADAAMMVDDQLPADDAPTPVGEPATGVPPAARGTRRTNHVCSIKVCANLLSPSNPWKMCDLCRSRDRAGRRLKALRDSGLIPPEVAAGKIVEVRMEVEGKERERKDKDKEKGAKKKKGRKKKGQETETETGAEAQEGSGSAEGSGAGSSGVTMDGGVPDGSITPSVPHEQGGEDSQTSVFSSVPIPNHTNLVFMEPLLGQLASHLEQHLPEASGRSASNAMGESQESEGSEGQDGGAAFPSDRETADAAAVVSPPPAKKRRKGKGKGKETQDETAAQPTQPSASASTSTPVTSTEPPEAPPVHYPPPPSNGQHPYPYYIPPFMPPYGASPGFPYGYPPPPPSPSKGTTYSPPVYQPPPYGAYPYPYPYPGHPYPYPNQPYPPPPGQSYSPPPPGQSYSPPPPYAPPPGEQSQYQSQYQYQYQQPPAGHPPYPPPMPYPYVHPYPVPPPSQPSQPAATEQSQQHPQQPYPPAPEEPSSSAQSTASTKRSTRTSTKSNGVKDNASNHPTTAEEPREPPQKETTFIVRTSETYELPMNNPNRPLFVLKRPREEDYGDMSLNKRAELEAHARAPGTYSRFRVSLPNTRTPTPVPGMGMMDASQFAPAPVVAESVQVAPIVVEDVQAVPVPAALENDSLEMVHCSHKTCKRVLPAGAAGSFCDRCRERLKKKQAKAKHRFKLEPKALLGRDSTVAASA